MVCRAGEACQASDCVCANGCDDGEACTEDRCVQNRCEHSTLDGDNDGYCNASCPDAETGAAGDCLDGDCEDGDASYSNAYGTWTANMLRAAYNYQYVAKDPGAYAHNPTYIVQVLYDALQDIGGDTTGMVRP